MPDLYTRLFIVSRVQAQNRLRTLLRRQRPRDEEAGPGPRTAAEPLGVSQHTERDGASRLQRTLDPLHVLDGRDGLTVDGQNDIALDDADIVGERAGLYTDYLQPVFAQGSYGIALGLVQFADVDPEACLLRFRADLFLVRAAQGVILALLQNLCAVADRQLEIQLLAAAVNRDVRGRADRQVSHAVHQVVAVFDRFAVQGQDDVLCFQARFLRRSVREDVRDQNAMVGAESAQQVRLVVLVPAIPMDPRVTRPDRMMSLYTFTAMFIGSAKPMPWYPPLCVAIMVLTPITSPRMFSSGPPLLPGLMAASVWMKRWKVLLPPMSRAGRTDDARGHGRFQAERRSDGDRPISDLHPIRVADGDRLHAASLSILMTATSVSLSVPMTLAR